LVERRLAWSDRVRLTVRADADRGSERVRAISRAAIKAGVKSLLLVE
jgi:hypothetical protein